MCVYLCVCVCESRKRDVERLHHAAGAAACMCCALDHDVCMFVLIYVWWCVRVYVCVYTSVVVECVSLCIHVYMYTCIQVCVHICIYIYVYVHIYVYTHICSEMDQSITDAGNRFFYVYIWETDF